jgi:hypothetical protein
MSSDFVAGLVCGFFVTVIAVMWLLALVVFVDTRQND